MKLFSLKNIEREIVGVFLIIFKEKIFKIFQVLLEQNIHILVWKMVMSLICQAIQKRLKLNVISHLATIQIIGFMIYGKVEFGPILAILPDVLIPIGWFFF